MKKRSLATRAELDVGSHAVYPHACLPTEPGKGVLRHGLNPGRQATVPVPEPPASFDRPASFATPLPVPEPPDGLPRPEPPAAFSPASLKASRSRVASTGTAGISSVKRAPLPHSL